MPRWNDDVGSTDLEACYGPMASIIVHIPFLLFSFGAKNEFDTLATAREEGYKRLSFGKCRGGQKLGKVVRIYIPFL